MVTAKDIMTTEIITFSPELEIGQAAKRLLEKRINGAPVVDASGCLVGILCQSDLIATQKKLALPSLFTLLDGFIPLQSMKSMEREWHRVAALTVAEAMSKKPTSVSPDTPIDEIATLMVEKGFHSLPVMDGQQLVGIIGKQDVLKILA